MSPASNKLEKKKKTIEKTMFSPLEKLRLKFEASDFNPLKKIQPKKLSLSVDDLINAESELGRTIFGPIPVGHQREFFRHTKNVWIWHENWTEGTEKREITVKYEVRKDGVYKKLQSKSYEKITGAELENFRKALHAYLKVIKEKLY